MIMYNNKLKIFRSHTMIWGLAVILLTLTCGCQDWMGQRTSGLQNQKILENLSKIDTVPDPNIRVPDVYKTPPKKVKQIVGGAEEWKLSYFCMYHTSDELKKIIYEQFATKLFDKKGKETKLVDYTVSSNATANQLIVRCPTEEDVDAVLELLEMVDVPPIQVKIDCLISEVYADKTLDWQTTLEIENLFGEGIRAGSSAQPFGTGITELVEEQAVLPAFPGASLREVARAKMGLQIGYVSDSENFLAMVDLLESKGYLKILMNPTLEIINGKTAKISSSQRVPLQTIYLTNPNQDWYETKTEYVEIVDSLVIVPHVFADGYIGLETSILLGSKLTPEGVKQLPIVTKKEIENKENRIRQGESLVIGGIRKTEERDVIRGVPILKDIPLLGVLFSGRDFEERVVETIFILTPTISTGGKPNEKIVEELRERHKSPSSQAFHEAVGEAVIDTLGLENESTEQGDEAEQKTMEPDTPRESDNNGTGTKDNDAEQDSNEAQT
jgi:type II secretory pathway component GspD/PulD (secretin)